MSTSHQKSPESGLQHRPAVVHALHAAVGQRRAAAAVGRLHAARACGRRAGGGSFAAAVSGWTDRSFDLSTQETTRKQHREVQAGEPDGGEGRTEAPPPDPSLCVAAREQDPLNESMGRVKAASGERTPPPRSAGAGRQDAARAAWRSRFFYPGSVARTRRAMQPAGSAALGRTHCGWCACGGTARRRHRFAHAPAPGRASMRG